VPRTRPPKVQRWIDLLAALLVRRFPASFAELARDVPAYGSGDKSPASLMRMFERDKDELRAFGIPIETVMDASGERAAYRLQHRHFYLPYLGVAAPATRSAATRLDRFGYRALTTLAFEPDELDAVAAAGARVRALGDPLLAAEADSALRKLAVDLPLRPGEPGDILLLAAEPPPAAATFQLLGEALRRRKVVEFEYYTISGDRTETRTVEPYGLFFLGSHWYLAARDRARGEPRTYRLSRLASPRLADTRTHTPDFTIPDEFDLREHARSRRAWELGAGDGMEAVVHFHRATGAARAALRLGTEIEGDPRRRAFEVRRPNAFARWLLSFAGDAEPVSPPELVAAYRALVAETRRAYDQPASSTQARA
jgi:predicted DNA-binding transcriptional regulator YafY